MVFVYLTHIVRIIFDPFLVALAFLAASLLFRRFRRVGLFLALAALLLLVVSGSPVISGLLISSLERQYPDSPVEAIPPAEAIVVLGGSVREAYGHHPASHLIDSSDRLIVALRLYRAGKAPLVLCSGGNLALFSRDDGPPESKVMSGMLQEWGVPGSAILTEEHSVNTHENATMSFQLLSSRNIHKIILVTSAIHMPRAVAVFRKIGFEVVPAPADFLTGWAEGDIGWFPAGSSLKDTTLALREWVGLWVYRLRGWA